MLARSLAVLVLALLAVVAAHYKFETELQEGETPQIDTLIHLGDYVIPDGQCTGELDMVHTSKGEICMWPGAAGIRTLKAIVDDDTPMPSIEFNSNRRDGKPNDIVVYRKGDCKGDSVLHVYYNCEMVYGPITKPAGIGAKGDTPILKSAKGRKRRNIVIKH